MRHNIYTVCVYIVLQFYGERQDYRLIDEAPIGIFFDDPFLYRI